MVRAINYLSELPDESLQSGLPLRKILVSILYALTYAPDREFSGSFRRFRKEFERYFGFAAKLEEALEKEFFNRLYVDRIEREKIEKMIPARRLILVHGLIGVGKTVVLKKIRKNLNNSGNIKFVYFDFKEITELFEKVTSENFREKFRRVIYKKMYEDYVAKSKSFLKEWDIYKIRFDDGYSDFREWVLSFVQRPLETESEWQDIISEVPIRERYNNLSVQAQLKTILLFLKDKIAFVLCFDNVDRYQIKFQREMLSVNVDISNEVQIPIILAIREPNLKLLISEGDVVIINYLERLKAGDEKSLIIENMPNASILALLENRIDFIKKQKSFSTLTDFFEQLERKHEFSFNDFNKRFWEIFHILSKTFIDQGVYRYCNYNIREILTLYFRMISKILLNPEDKYNISTLLIESKTISKTKLRTFFYKWLICSDCIIPKLEGGLINIYRHCVPNLRMLDLRILEFLYNWEIRNPGSGIHFDVMALKFRRFGVDQEVLKIHILELTKSQGLNELGFVWLDRLYNAPITDTTVIELMPAGQYFLEKISNSREYTFWNALTADLEKDIVGKRFSINGTYQDSFKLDVVYKFAEQILFPALKNEIEYFDKN